MTFLYIITDSHYNGLQLYTENKRKTNALTIIIFGISNGSAIILVLITCNSDKESYQ